MSSLLLACQAVIGIAFGVAAASKLRGRAAYQAFRASLPKTIALPRRLAGPVAAAVVLAEASTVVAVAVPALVVPGFALATALLVAFTAVVLTMMRRGSTEPCHCFGATDHPPGPAELARNVLLLAVACGGLVLSLTVDRPAGGDSGGAMPDVTTLVYLVGVLSVVNTVLLVEVIRRLRHQSEHFRRHVDGMLDPAPIMLEAGATVGDFDAVTLDGERVTRHDLRGPMLVGFLSSGCPACLESLPAFLARAESFDGGRDRVLAVVVGIPEATASLSERLTPVARVVNEPEQGPLWQAFGVIGVPAFALLDGQTVAASHFVLARLGERVTQ